MSARLPLPPLWCRWWTRAASSCRHRTTLGWPPRVWRHQAETESVRQEEQERLVPSVVIQRATLSGFNYISTFSLSPTVCLFTIKCVLTARCFILTPTLGCEVGNKSKCLFFRGWEFFCFMFGMLEGNIYSKTFTLIIHFVLNMEWCQWGILFTVNFRRLLLQTNHQNLSAGVYKCFQLQWLYYINDCIPLCVPVVWWPGDSGLVGGRLVKRRFRSFLRVRRHRLPLPEVEHGE